MADQFRMLDDKTVNTHLDYHIKLSVKQYPQTEEEKNIIESTPCESKVGSIMYGLVCTRPKLTYEVSILSQFMPNHGQVHW